MSRFKEKYFTMNEQDAAEYALIELDFFKPGSKLICKEIGDGNLNYVFRIIDEKSGESIIIKQAGPVARISDEFKVSIDRNRIESDILKLQYELTDGLVPKVYKYDPIMNCCAMEDLTGHEIMRTALLQHKIFPDFADDISTFMANTLFLTSDVAMNHKDKKALVKNFINPDLCEITEDLVYTEPFYDCSRNDMLQETKDFVSKYFWQDRQLLLETTKLKFEFMTNGQSLLHGDLHTGSIFVKEGSTKIIDPEFAFYGPAGYDVGNILANLVFAYENAEAVMDDGKEKEVYKAWISKMIEDIVELFKQKFSQLWKEKSQEKTANYEGFKEYYIGKIISDAAAVTGCELSRRIIGLAHVNDIISIENIEKRVKAEKVCLVLAKSLILKRESISNGKQFINELEGAVEKIDNQSV
ncbi:S-methyl-5-thioribose kinase [Clostridium oryzae]|uniref:S-methyl-5-thioribose kinase n=1 Tax=Clostridium oryzae TaxID=1450648 RepID=A0A1V4IXA5_9CLOT|nr:S-methyl-5-thioribose kinase [Clostridium oryzae]OPJ64671.1 methylthioribose kinase [Clostridium oryzae]